MMVSWTVISLKVNIRIFNFCFTYKQRWHIHADELSIFYQTKGIHEIKTKLNEEHASIYVLLRFVVINYQFILVVIRQNYIQ